MRLWLALPMTWQPRTILPHTTLEVGRIGLGSSFGVDPSDLEYAYDHGINYFYWGSVRRPGFGEGIRRLARRDRDGIIVVLQSYARWPAALFRQSVLGGLRRLRLDHADVLLLGGYTQRPSQAILDEAFELREKGRARHLMISGHRRSFFPEMAREEIFDLFMVRYNAANRGAESDVFSKLPGDASRPALCTYTATRRATLLDPRKVPEGENVPGAGDCYRFNLSHPAVDMTLCGPANREHVHEACEALAKGPMDEAELAWMRRVGDHVYGRSPDPLSGD